MIPQSWLMLSVFLCFFMANLWVSCSEALTIYDVLRSHGLPMGLFPKGVTDFRVDSNGRLEVHLDKACNAKFESEFHYDQNISGVLDYGLMSGLSGMSAQDLFLWFPVKKIRVDVPSSGLIYFDVGVVSKQFSLSSFESPRDCRAVAVPDVRDTMIIRDSVSEDSLVIKRRLEGRFCE